MNGKNNQRSIRAHSTYLHSCLLICAQQGLTLLLFVLFHGTALQKILKDTVLYEIYFEQNSFFRVHFRSVMVLYWFQLGFVEILRALKLEPEGIVGHSVGELGCAYADNCLTLEQTILAAHARGRASLESTLIKGMMAAVGTLQSLYLKYLGTYTLKDRAEIIYQYASQSQILHFKASTMINLIYCQVERKEMRSGKSRPLF